MYGFRFSVNCINESVRSKPDFKTEPKEITKFKAQRQRLVVTQTKSIKLGKKIRAKILSVSRPRLNRFVGKILHGLSKQLYESRGVASASERSNLLWNRIAIEKVSSLFGIFWFVLAQIYDLSWVIFLRADPESTHEEGICILSGQFEFCSSWELALLCVWFHR